MTQMADLLAGVRAILFDLDGTLVETEIDFALMKREMLAFAEREGVSPFGLQSLDILSIVNAVVRSFADRGVPDDAIRIRREALDILERIELTHSASARAIPGARELLGALRDAAIGIGIVTRNCRKAAQVSLDRAGIVCDVLLTRDDVENVKPHADHLLQALRMLGAGVGEAVMIGDHWMDVQSGRAASVRTVGFLRAGRPDGLFDCCPPDVIVSDLRELIPRVARCRGVRE